MPDVGVLILAAGGSSRMGAPKQLIPYAGRSLLRSVAETAIESRCGPVVVVLGAQHDRVAPELQHLPVRIMVNDRWQSGMGSSIRLGLRTALDHAPGLSALVILLCDQPLVSTEIIHQLIGAHQSTGKWIVASAYADTLGPPVLFSRDAFSWLEEIPNRSGAKSVLEEHSASVASIPFADGAIDLDTPEDIQKLGIPSPASAIRNNSV